MSSIVKNHHSNFQTEFANCINKTMYTKKKLYDFTVTHVSETSPGLL